MLNKLQTELLKSLNIDPNLPLEKLKELIKEKIRELKSEPALAEENLEEFNKEAVTTNYTGRQIVNQGEKNPQDFVLWKFIDEKSLQKWRFGEVLKDEEFLDLESWIVRLDEQEIDLILKELKLEDQITEHKLKNPLHNKQLVLIAFLEKVWGCPGWHSECVAMISEIIGKKRFSRQDFSFKKLHIQQDQQDKIPQSAIGRQPLDSSIIESYEIDLHLGGEDHIDIHHKNEILQSESLGFHLSQFWVHNRFVLVSGKKMSKSLGNVFMVNGKYKDTGFYSFENPPVQEFSGEFKKQIAKKYLELKLINKMEEMDWEKFRFDPLAYRLMMFEHHYTQQLDFTWEKLWQSQMRLWGMRKEKAKAHSFWLQNNPQNLNEELFNQKKQTWLGILTENLNFPEFLNIYQKTLLDLSNSIQKNNFSCTDYFLLLRFDEDLFRLKIWGLNSVETDEIWQMGKIRFQAKEAKDWAKADGIRSQIQQLGWQIDDYPWGWGVWWRGC